MRKPCNKEGMCVRDGSGDTVCDLESVKESERESNLRERDEVEAAHNNDRDES